MILRIILLRGKGKYQCCGIAFVGFVHDKNCRQKRPETVFQKKKIIYSKVKQRRASAMTLHRRY